MTTKTTIHEAAEYINATIDGEYVYYHDDAMDRDYRADADSLECLAELIDSDDDRIAADAYSFFMLPPRKTRTFQNIEVVSAVVNRFTQL